MPNIIQQNTAEDIYNINKLIEDNTDGDKNFKVEIDKLVASGTLNGHNGKSAYEIAVEHGFTGTEVEWLASLTAESAICSILDGAIEYYENK